MKNLPISPKLNNFIENWFESKKDLFTFVSVDDFDENDIEGTLKKHIKRFEDTKKINIWTGESEKTIFASSKINHKFRAWHDFYHITKNLSYNPEGEILVCEEQKKDLPKNFDFEKTLLDIEIKGQIEYFEQKNKFVSNQYNFCIEYLKNGIDGALKIN